ncbi:MAG: thioredoxin-dependent thiol peroxidase [Acidimicrobiia bacterium]
MALDSGDRAPDFAATDHDGRTVRLADYAGKGLVLYFYPKAFTPGCTTQACDLRDRYQTFAAAGYEVVGISPDPPERLAEFRGEHDLPFSMLSDQDHAIARAYGAYGTKKNYGREYEGIIRSTFVIGSDGRVVDAWINVRAKGHGDRLARLLS